MATTTPAGRLPVTFYRSVDQLPPFADYNMKGRTYQYFEDEPLYPFGHGVSYTTFEYAGLRTSAETLGRDGTVTVSIDISNTGDRAGDEVVQLYIAHPKSEVDRPQKELKGFARISLEPDETKTAEFPLRGAKLGYRDAERDQWVVERAPIELMVGASSQDIRLRDALDVVD